MAYSLAQTTLDLLSKKVCTKENQERASKYLKEKRKLIAEDFLYTPFYTSNLSKFVENNRSIFWQDWLSDSLYFPIVSLNKEKLIGFDVRYLGKDPSRTRYYKIKVEDCTFFNYNSKSIFEENSTLFLTEGIIDLETLRVILKKAKFGPYSIISPLTCLTNPEYLKILLFSFTRIIICYDNDDAGNKAKSKIKAFAKKEDLKDFFFLDFLGKDINENYKALSSNFLLQGINRIKFELSV